MRHQCEGSCSADANVKPLQLALAAKRQSASGTPVAHVYAPAFEAAARNDYAFLGEGEGGGGWEQLPGTSRQLCKQMASHWCLFALWRMVAVPLPVFLLLP